jgi:PAS domain S-box-containing protein
MITKRKSAASKSTEILVVEDSITQATQIKHLLENHHYKVTVAHNGGEALNKLLKHKPALVISDIMMPRMNGYELCKKIKSNKKTEDIPVILLTVLADPKEIIEGLSCGADSFITKPYDKNYLLSHVKRTLSGGNIVYHEKVPFDAQIFFKGKKRYIQTEQQNVIKLMISIYEGAIHQNEKLLQTQEELKLLNERLESMVMDRTADLTEEIKLSNQIAERLKESEERWRTLVLTMPEYIGLVDCDGKFLFLNHYAEGFSEEDTIGKSHLDFIPDEWKEFYQKKFEECIVTQRNQVFEYSAFGDNKEIRTYETCLVPIVKQGKVSNIMAIARDITERSVAEKALQENEKKYHDIFDNVTDLYYETSLDGTIIDISPSISILSKGQYQREELIGKSMSEFYSDPDKRQSFLTKLREDGRVTDYEITLKNRDGSSVPCSVSSKIRVDSHGKPDKIIGSMRDITDRKLVEEELKKNQSQLMNALKIAHLGPWEYDVENNTFLFNDLFYAIFRTTAEQVGGYKMKSADYANRFVHPEDMAIVGTEISKAIETDDPDFSRQLEHRIIYADGETGYITVRFFVVKDKMGKTVRTYGVNQDITQRKLIEVELSKAAEQMKLAKEKAETSDKLKTTFLNNISHEIRTPLNGILGFAEIMSQTDLSEEEKQVSLSMLFESSDRLLTTITNYMDISLITSGNLTVNRRDFIPEKIMKELLGKYKTMCSGRNLELLLKLPEHADKLSINSDPEILTKTISHLLSNAIKFTEEGSIQYGYMIRDNELEFFVKDTGIGIGKESLNDVFEKFIKEDRGPLKITEGSGLGLSISKGLVELLGGRIFVESEIGKGSCFFFTIPRVKESEIRHSITKTGSMNKKKTIKSILVAEDDEINYFYLKALLKQITSAGIIHASNGREAVDKFKENSDIGLVLMDIKMPVMDGYTAIKLIRESKPDIPIIAQTAYTDDKTRILEEGCDGFLSKPFDKQKLLSVIKEFI